MVLGDGHVERSQGVCRARRHDACRAIALNRARDLAEIDQNAKTGKVDPLLALDTFIVSL